MGELVKSIWVGMNRFKYVALEPSPFINTAALLVIFWVGGLIMDSEDGILCSEVLKLEN